METIGRGGRGQQEAMGMQAGSGDPPVDGEEEDEDTVYAKVFPASSKLDAYGMALDDIAVFEAAGHPREGIGQLATYGFVTFAGMRLLLRSLADGLRNAGHPVASNARVPVPPFARVLRGLRFLDLGSGDGRAVIGAAILAPTLREAAGLELSTSRHELALKNRARLPEAFRNVVNFEHGDIMTVDRSYLAAADLVWVANLRFPDEAVEAVNERLERDCAMRSSAVVATLRECHFTRPHSVWTLQVPMSWNSAGWPVFCYYLAASQTDAT